MRLLSILRLRGNKVKNALRKGATIIDVRTASDFDQGKIRNSFNIPIERVDLNLGRIRNMRRPIIICGDSHQSAEVVLSILRENGVNDVHNGGNWGHLLKVIRSL